MTITYRIPAKKQLEKSLREDLEDVLVVGTDKTGAFYFAGNFSDVEPIKKLLRRALREIGK